MKMHEIKAYFGTDIKGISVVSDAAFKLFMVQYLDKHFKCYTITESTGTWHGQSEKCFVFSVITSEFYESLEKIKEVAEAYKAGFDQESVLIDIIEVNAIFV